MIELLEKYGWTVECESPFEIRHEDGSFATGQAARCVLDSLKEEFEIFDVQSLIDKNVFFDFKLYKVSCVDFYKDKLQVILRLEDVEKTQDDLAEFGR